MIMQPCMFKYVFQKYILDKCIDNDVFKEYSLIFYKLGLFESIRKTYINSNQWE